MKLLLGLCLVICIVGANCEDIATMIKNAKSASPHIAACLAESKLDQKTLENVKEKNAIPNTPEMQCYVACMMKKDEMMNADGTFTKKFVEDARTEGCRNLGGKDTCEKAFKVVQCLVKADPPKELYRTK